MPIRAVVFDLFDTLVDLTMENLPRVELAGRSVPSTARAVHAAVAERADVSFEVFVETLGSVDREYREGRYTENLELPTEERFATLAARLGIDDPELPLILTAVHMGHIREQVSVPEHHADLLGALRRRVRLGLCSNFSHTETALGVLEEHGLRTHLDAVAISEEVGHRKPGPVIFTTVLERLGVDAADTLHVGDSLRADVAGAAALGMRTVWITRRVADPEARLRGHEGPPPDFSIHDIAEIPGLLGG